MKTAARRASRRLIVLIADELHDCDVDGVDLRRRTSARARRRPSPAPRATSGRTRPYGRETPARRARVRPRARTQRRRRLRSRAPSTAATAPSHDLAQRGLAHAHRAAGRPETSTRLTDPASAGSRAPPPRGTTSSTRRCGTRRCRGCRAARRASSARPRSRTRSGRGAPARSRGRGSRRRTISFAMSES